MFKIIDSGTTLNDEHLIVMEKAMDIVLPDDYREFLQKYNGGFPEHEFFRSEDKKPNISLAGFSSVQFADSKPDFQDFLIDDPLVDEKFIVIGFDGCGNYLCMRKDGKDKGKLYFFDHDTDERIWEIGDIDPKKTELPWCAAYKVQDNFEALVANNYEEEDEEPETSGPHPFLPFKITDPGDAISEKNIKALEKELGIQLPDTYRTFMKRYNGGTPEYNDFKAVNDRSDIFIQSFSDIVFTTDDPEKELEINFMFFLTYDPLIDEKFFVIGNALADDENIGMTLCMRKDGKDKGKIYLFERVLYDGVVKDMGVWEIEDIDPKKTDVEWCGAYRVQDSFESLLAANFEAEYDEDDMG